MPIQKGDIQFLKAQVSGDVPEGGGAPTATVIVDGASNQVFADISEIDRAGGAVSLSKIFLSVRTDDTDTYLDANIIVAKPPLDPNVSVTIFSPNEVFDRRINAQKRLEQYLIQSYGTPYYLLENHVKDQRVVQFYARPGVAPPNINRTLVLTGNPGLETQYEQFIRVIRVTTETRTFTYSDGGGPVDYQAVVLSCELSDKLRYDFAGSPPSPFFTPAVGKTETRDTNAADAGNYYGVSALASPAGLGDQTVTVDSIYTQLVPSARTEAAALDQRPAAVRNVELATVPRVVSIVSSPHTSRLFIDQENRSFNYVNILQPPPAPGTVDVSYMALGNWYSIQDDGNGNLTGAGVGTVNYLTGSISITLPALPDARTSVIYTWGEKLAFTNRSGQAGFRAPEYSFQVVDGSVAKNSLSIKWTSAAVLRTATDDGAGQITGAATGTIDYATGTIVLQPSYMIDSGGQFAVDYQYDTKVTKSFSGVTVDAGGFALLALDSVPVAGTLAVQWATSQTVSGSAGGTLTSGSSGKTGSTTVESSVVAVPFALATDFASAAGIPGLKFPPANAAVRYTPSQNSAGDADNGAPHAAGLVWQIGVYPDNTAAFGVLQPMIDPMSPLAAPYYDIPNPNTPVPFMPTSLSDPRRVTNAVASLPLIDQP